LAGLKHPVPAENFVPLGRRIGARQRLRAKLDRLVAFVCGEIVVREKAVVLKPCGL